MSEPSVVRIDLPATNAHLNVLCACIDAVLERIEGLEEREVTAYNIQLAANEVLANIVRHAYEGVNGGRVDIVLTLEDHPRRLVLDLHDTGRPFDRQSVPKPDLEDVQIHGYGLFLVEQLMDVVDYRAEPDGNHWRLVKHL